jgi:hypothetical protein
LGFFAFSAYAIEYSLDKDAASKIASGFGGGMGRMGQMCGAVTGAYNEMLKVGGEI